MHDEVREIPGEKPQVRGCNPPPYMYSSAKKPELIPDVLGALWDS